METNNNKSGIYPYISSSARKWKSNTFPSYSLYVANKDFAITYKIKSRPYIKGLLFKDIKDKVLGKSYSLSLVFIENKESKKLNFQYRKKIKPTNVLAFPINKMVGEIFINIDSIRKEHLLFGRSQKNFIAFLYIHALLHLKGYDHSSKMEDAEKKIRILFGLE